MTTDQLVHSYFTWLSWYFALPEPARRDVGDWHLDLLAAALAARGVDVTKAVARW